MLYYLLLIALLVLVVMAVEFKDLLYSVIALGSTGVVLTALFFIFKAPDIAITKAVASAGIGMVLFIIAISRTQRLEEP